MQQLYISHAWIQEEAGEDGGVLMIYAYAAAGRRAYSLKFPWYFSSLLAYSFLTTNLFYLPHYVLFIDH
jgi:hypothetical protein